MAVTKHNFLVTEASRHSPGDPRRVPHRHNRSPRPGAGGSFPRTSSIPTTRVHTSRTTTPRVMTSRATTRRSNPHSMRCAQRPRLIMAAERPVLYTGGGILKARAAEPLRELAELLDIHVVTTLMNRGGFPDDHPLALGMPGMHGTYTAVTAMQEADLLDRARRALRRPGHGPSRRVRLRAPRWCTPTSTQRSSTRCARPTWPFRAMSA